MEVQVDDSIVYNNHLSDAPNEKRKSLRRSIRNFLSSDKSSIKRDKLKKSTKETSERSIGKEDTEDSEDQLEPIKDSDSLFISQNLTARDNFSSLKPTSEVPSNHTISHVTKISRMPQHKYEELRKMLESEVRSIMTHTDDQVDNIFRLTKVQYISAPPMIDEMPTYKKLEITFEEEIKEEMEGQKKEYKQVKAEAYLADEKSFDAHITKLIDQAKIVIAKRLEQKQKEEESTKDSEKHKHEEDDEMEIAPKIIPYHSMLFNFINNEQKKFILLVISAFIVIELLIGLLYNP